jgi:hypothetical protein
MNTYHPVVGEHAVHRAWSGPADGFVEFAAEVVRIIHPADGNGPLYVLRDVATGDERACGACDLKANYAPGGAS